MLLAKVFFTGMFFATITSYAQDITIGAVAMDAPIEMIKRMTPLTDYLAKHTGYKMQFRPAPNLDTAVTDLGEGTVQMAYMTPIAYIRAREKYRVEPLVVPLTHGKSTFNLVVVVRRHSAYQKLEDLKGKRFAFGDPKAYLQPAVLLDAGMRVQDFSEVAYLKHYDNIAKAILHGDFEAGIMKDAVYEKFASQGLRALYTSPPLSSYVFAVSEKLDAQTQQKLKNALLSLNIVTPEGRAVLNTLDRAYEGFQSTSDKDYDRERALIARLKNN